MCVCAHLWTCLQRGLFVRVCTHRCARVHSYLPDWCLASGVLESLGLGVPVSLGIFSWCLAIPVMGSRKKVQWVGPPPALGRLRGFFYKNPHRGTASVPTQILTAHQTPSEAAE